MAAASSNPFSARLVFALVGAGIVAFAAFLILSAYAGNMRSGRDGRGHALSVSAVGFKGIVELVELTGGEARLVSGFDARETEDLLVVTLESRTEADEIGALIEQRTGSATLLVLPKWMAFPHPTQRGWVTRGGIMEPEMIASLLEPVGPIAVQRRRAAGTMLTGVGLLDGIQAPAPRQVQTVAGDEVTPLLTGPGGGAVLARIGEQPLYVLADPDLLNNHGLKDRRRAVAALEMLAALNSTGAEGVAFDLTLNGLGEKPSALRLAFEPPFVALTLALFAAALLAGLHGAFRFGPEAEEERAIAFGKAALVENSAALIRLARREHRAGEAYADLIREEAARASAAPAGLAGAQIDAYLDRLSQPGARNFSDLANRLRTAGSRAELVSAARALFQWRKELIL